MTNVVMVSVSSILTLQLIIKINNMFKVKQNDKFSQPMNKQELYQTTKMGKSMKMTPFLIELQQAKQLFEECGFQYKEEAKQEMDKFIKQITTKNGVTNY